MFEAVVCNMVAILSRGRWVLNPVMARDGGHDIHMSRESETVILYL